MLSRFKMPMSLCEAIARQEGFYVSNSRAARNHNPGNVEYGPFAKLHGATGTDGRFAIFPNDSVGFLAMQRLLESKYTNHTVAAMLQEYAPPNENETEVYVQRVCLWTGCKPTDTVSEVFLAANKPKGQVEV